MSVTTEAAASTVAPIFILGNGRSGTTLMRFMLNAHPDIYISEEVCYHFWLRNVHGSYRRRLYQFFQSFNYAWLRMPPQDVLTAWPEPEKLDWADASSVYLRILQCKAAQYGKARYGEKGPLLTEELDQLFKEYPQAKIIHMVRDPRAVVYSHFTMPWSTSSFIAANVMVWSNMRTLARYKHRLLTVKLEDLLAAPEPALRRILDFIGVPWNAQVLNHTEYLPENDGIPFPWLMEASKQRRQKALSWREAIPPAWIRLTESWNRTALQDHGYAALDLPHEPGAFARLWAIVKDLPALVFTGWRLLRITLGFLLLPKSQTARYQALLHSLNPEAWERQPDWSPELPEPPAVNAPAELLK